MNQKGVFQTVNVIVSLLSKNRDKKIKPYSAYVMLLKIYHIYCKIKSLDKFGNTNKPTYHQPQDTPTTESALDDMTTVPSESDHIRSGIVMKLDLTQMGAGNKLFIQTSGAMFQGSGAVKLVSVHPSGAHSSSSHEQMESDSRLPSPFTKKKISLSTWCMVFLATGRSMKILLVICTVMTD